jgi:restriction system protein
MGRKKTNSELPTYDEFIIPVIRALKELGGSGSIEEINSKVYELTNLHDDIIQIPHGNDGYYTEVDYRLAWTRTYLKKYGLLENSERGIWALSKSDIDLSSVKPEEIVRTVKEQTKKSAGKKIEKDKSETTELKETPEETSQNEKLLDVIMSLSPNGFERLCQRLLRESGFQQVTVTQKTRDGGFDGEGILQINPLVSLKVLFQCKRYKDAVSSPTINEFRGVVDGRADKGIVITTGRFTSDAKKEAVRLGTKTVELVDGEKLVEMFEKLLLGVKAKTVYEVDNKFFEEFK